MADTTLMACHLKVLVVPALVNEDGVELTPLQVRVSWNGMPVSWASDVMVGAKVHEVVANLPKPPPRVLVRAE